MELAEITPLLITYNEAPNLPRTLAALAWARQIVIVDSFSTDETVRIAQADPRVRLVQRVFDSHVRQWSFALHETGLTSEWVLALDADYVLDSTLIEELGDLQPPPGIAGYEIPFRYQVRGKLLRGSLYPPSIVLYRRSHAHYVQEGHTQRLRINGAVGRLRGFIRHDDRKPFARWFSAQRRYTALEAIFVLAQPWRSLKWPDRARRLYLGPWLVAPYCLFAKALILDGWPGLVYTAQRFIAEALLAYELARAKLKL